MFFKKKQKFIPGILAKDPVDIRDYQLATIQPEAVELPEEFDLRNKMTSVQSQNWGSCTSHMADGIAEFWNSQEYHKEVKLSQKFIYHNTKKISGLWSIQGDYVRNAIASVCKYGVCLEETYPDDKQGNWEEYVKQEPPEKAYKGAERYKGKTYWRIGSTIDDFRQAVYQNRCPVGFGMMWASSYNKPEQDGRLPLPDKDVGGHAVDCVGWTKDKLWVRNSWGKDWGLNGYFYIPFDEFDRHTIWDCWVLLDQIEAPPQNLEGWTAIKYLTNTKGYKAGTQVKTTCRLNLRASPSIKSPKFITMENGQEGTVVDDELVSNDGYDWQKIKIAVPNFP